MKKNKTQQISSFNERNNNSKIKCKQLYIIYIIPRYIDFEGKFIKLIDKEINDKSLIIN